MFFASNCYGSHMLKEAFDRIHLPQSARINACARFLDVSERTLKDWLSGKKEPPRAVVYALWHESSLGRAVTAAHSEQDAHNYRMLSRMQGDRIATLERRIDAMSNEIETLKRDAFNAPANERFFTRY
jgi:hypothetical protein